MGNSKRKKKSHSVLWYELLLTQKMGFSEPYQILKKEPANWGATLATSRVKAFSSQSESYKQT